jgi:hypothetical protein
VTVHGYYQARRRHRLAWKEAEPTLHAENAIRGDP